MKNYVGLTTTNQLYDTKFINLSWRNIQGKKIKNFSGIVLPRTENLM
jgi:hypothetical protein